MRDTLHLNTKILNRDCADARCYICANIVEDSSGNIIAVSGRCKRQKHDIGRDDENEACYTSIIDIFDENVGHAHHAAKQCYVQGAIRSLFKHNVEVLAHLNGCRIDEH